MREREPVARGEPATHLHHVTKPFGAVHAVDEVSFDLPARAIPLRA